MRAIIFRFFVLSAFHFSSLVSRAEDSTPRRLNKWIPADHGYDEMEMKCIPLPLPA
jgi:hypothetical protein